MTDVAFEPSAARTKPGAVDVAFGTLGGFVLATIVLLPALWLADLAGVLAWSGEVARGTNFLGWPFPADGPWSVAASLGAVVLALAVTAVCTAWTIRGWTGRPAPVTPLFACLVVSGYAPYIGYDGVLGLRNAVAFLLMVILVRAWAADSGLRLGRRGRVAAAAVLVAAAGVFVAYGAAHPLYNAANVSVDGDEPAVAAFLLGSVGRGDVTIVRVEPERLPAPMARAEVERGTLPSRGETLVSFVPACGAIEGFATIERVLVHYRYLGRVRSQAIAIEPVRVTCP